jgi:hypothetical protein
MLNVAQKTERAATLAVNFFADTEEDRQLSRQILKDLGYINVADLFVQLFDIDEQLLLVTLHGSDYIQDYRIEVFET